MLPAMSLRPPIRLTQRLTIHEQTAWTLRSLLETAACQCPCTRSARLADNRAFAASCARFLRCRRFVLAQRTALLPHCPGVRACRCHLDLRSCFNRPAGWLVLVRPTAAAAVGSGAGLRAGICWRCLWPVRCRCRPRGHRINATAT